MGCGGSSAERPAAAHAPSGDEAASTHTPAQAAAPGGDHAPTLAAALDVALAGGHRSEANRARDRYRHPKETLTFFGLGSDMKVLEMSPGAGWYTELLAPVLRDHGQLAAAVPSPTGRSARYAKRFSDLVAKHPDVYDKVDKVLFEYPDHPSLGPANSLDMVLTFRSTHGWINSGKVQDVYRAMYEALKPGGVLGVVQHRAPPGAAAEQSAKRGYVPEAFVVSLCERIGFKLEARSELNANPKDTTDHPKGVWTLPPSLALGEQDRDKYLAIGESDRMTLKFRKPAEH
ncbi:MAG: methyltransferase [Proteobacteria bacterium]|nr:methyltransferase [Pseudomonadota bacterium]